MTQHSRHVRRTIVGSAEDIATVLQTADRQGRLVAVTPPRLHAPGQFVVTAVLVETAPLRPAQRPAQPRSSVWRHKGHVVFVAAVLAFLAALAVLIVVAVQWVIAHAAVLGGSALILAALLLGLRAKTGACVGLHCGCGHR